MVLSTRIHSPLDRRTFLGITAAGVGGLALPRRGAAPGPPAGFPRQDADLVRRVVQVAHFDLDAVRQLVSERPALAGASWDWGFGDWETPLGAASHTGGRAIADLLLGHGARPDLFTFAMLGDVEAVRTMIAARPGVQRIPGPHGLSLLHHARAGGAEADGVVAYLLELGDADPRPVNRPLSADERRAYGGAYRIVGAGTAFRIIEREESLAFQHAEDAPRALLHQGGGEFHPVGAPAVRFSFRSDTGEVTIRDGGDLVTAVRTGTG